MKDELLARRCRALKLLLTDVDGVMTDGTVLLLPDGREAKSFHIRDGLAIVLAHAAGLRTGLLSGRASESVARAGRGAAAWPWCARACATREPCSRRSSTAEDLEAHEVAYIGDDLNDLPVLAGVGLSAAPARRRLRGAHRGLHGARGAGRAGVPARVRGGDPHAPAASGSRRDRRLRP